MTKQVKILTRYVIVALSIGLITIGCIKTKKSPGIERPVIISQDTTEKKDFNDEEILAVSLFGRSFTRMALPDYILSKRKRDLDAAKINYENNPDSLKAIIWYGRRLGYLGRYKEAVEIFSVGVDKYPESFKLLRHRGYGYIILRKFEKAINDLERAAFFMRGDPVEIEEDGIPNYRNVPLTTSQFNVWYYLGIAYYFRGNYDKAISSFRKCLEFSKNDDLLVASTDWLYMTYRKIGNREIAESLLEPVEPKMRIIEKFPYHKRLLLYKGLIEPKDLLREPSSKLTSITQKYGLANWHYYNGRKQTAKQLFEEILTHDYWFALGYIGAEVELYNMGFDITYIQ